MNVANALLRWEMSIAVGLFLSASLNAQVPTDLASKKDFQVYRASSADPRGLNGDNRPIPAGGTLLLADVTGAGRFTHFWMTFASDSPEVLREVVIRIKWDDAKTPAVECPIGDFFVQGPGKSVEFSSAAVAAAPNNALNCYWPMPFKKHAVITLTNEGTQEVGAVWWNFDYRIQKHPDHDLRYFHTQYRNYFPAPVGKPLTICDVKGSGTYVGTVVTVLANSDGWWGEGNDLWTIDGESALAGFYKGKTIVGTGSEDYFCGAFDFGHAYQTPFFGVTYYDSGEHRGIQNTVYRWHIPDPIPFQKTLRFELEHGSDGVSEDRKPFTNHYTTLGFYYVDHSEADLAPINKLKDRIPSLIPLNIDGPRPLR